VHKITTSDSIQTIIRSLPKKAFTKSLPRSFSYLLRDAIFVAALVTAIIFVKSWFFGPVLAVLLGTVLTGVFVIGHDCGHRSFCKSERLNNLVGHLTTSLTLWPFHVWRLSHDIHHRSTHHIGKDIAWRPFSFEKYNRQSRLVKTIYYYSRTSLFFIGSMFFSFYFLKEALRGRNSRHFEKKDLHLVRFSSLFTLVYIAAIVATICFYSGIYGFICIFLIPQLVFQVYLSTFTFFHHTNPERPFMTDESWTIEKAQLASTVHVSYPRLVEWLTHDISWHVPHHVCVGIPHYGLRPAHAALRATYDGVFLERKFGWTLVKSVIDECQLVTSTDPANLGWISISNQRSQSALQTLSSRQA